MVSRAEFQRAIDSETARERRIALFGALLGRATGAKITVVGGSAIAVYTLGKYVSHDIDITGSRTRIVPILKRWGFRLERGGERPYWLREDMGLAVDVLKTRYSGLEGHVQTMETPQGPVRLAAPEDLILRRLMYSKHAQKEAMAEAELLVAWFGDVLDHDYLEVVTRYERVEDRYRELLRRAGHRLIPSVKRRPGHRV